MTKVRTYLFVAIAVLCLPSLGYAICSGEIHADGSVQCACDGTKQRFRCGGELSYNCSMGFFFSCGNGCSFVSAQAGCPEGAVPKDGSVVAREQLRPRPLLDKS